MHPGCSLDTSKFHKDFCVSDYKQTHFFVFVVEHLYIQLWIGKKILLPDRFEARQPDKIWEQLLELMESPVRKVRIFPMSADGSEKWNVVCRGDSLQSRAQRKMQLNQKGTDPVQIVKSQLQLVVSLV